MERVSRHSFVEIHPVAQSLCRSYKEDSRYVVALDKSTQDIADFVAIKLAQGFVVSVAMTAVSAASKDEMLQQLTLNRL